MTPSKNDLIVASETLVAVAEAMVEGPSAMFERLMQMTDEDVAGLQNVSRDLKRRSLVRF